VTLNCRRRARASSPTPRCSAVPRHLRAELDRLRRRLVTILELIREVEAERDEVVTTNPEHQTSREIVARCRIRGLGENFAGVLTREVFYRSFDNRRQIASYVGITRCPTRAAVWTAIGALAGLGTRVQGRP